MAKKQLTSGTKKSTYVARKTINKRTLLSPDGTRRLTITLREGSAGKVNIAATIRSTDKDEDFPAETGAQGSFTSLHEGQSAMISLIEDSTKKGWVLEAGKGGSFSEIPVAPGVKGGKK